jgi:hypothetical protein
MKNMKLALKIGIGFGTLPVATWLKALAKPHPFTPDPDHEGPCPG